MSDSSSLERAPKPGSVKEVMRFSWPLIVSMSSNALMLFIDRIFLSWDSAASFQAVIPVGILSYVFLSGFMSFSSYTGVFVAQHFGAKDFRGCSRSAANGFVVAFISSIMILACIPLGLMLLPVFCDNPTLLKQEKLFLVLIMIAQAGVPFICVFDGFFNGIGKTRISMGFGLFRDVTKGILDYALIFGHFGFPRLGLRGAGIATIIVLLITPICMAFFYFSKKFQPKFYTRSELGFNFALCKRMLKFGLPAGVHQTLEIASYSIFALSLGKFGVLEQLAGNIAISIHHLAFISFLGLGFGSSILVGQYQGRREPLLALKSSLSALKVGASVAGLLALSILLFPEAYISLFAGHGGESASLETVLPIARPIFMIQALWTFLSACEPIAANSLKGAGDTRFVMLYASSLAWGYFACGLVAIIYIFHGSLATVWLWATSWELLLALGYIWRFYIQRRWRNIDLLGRDHQRP